MECTHVCAAQTTYYFFTKLYDFPGLADEIAETRPYMNIKVAAFTVSEKSINIFHNRLLNQLRVGLYMETENQVRNISTAGGVSRLML